MTAKWVLAPMNDTEVLAIRQRLEDGDIPGAQKYAVIQRLVESHLLANKQRKYHSGRADDYMQRLDKIVHTATKGR